VEGNQISCSVVIPAQERKVWSPTVQSRASEVPGLHIEGARRRSTRGNGADEAITIQGGDDPSI